MDAQLEDIPAAAEPERELSAEHAEIVEAMVRLLADDGHAEAAEVPRVGELVERLRTNVSLTDQDRLLLRLRYLNGMKMTEIVKLLDLQGDPYKRYHKLLAHLRRACQEAGLIAACPARGED